ncbi:MAG TPA: multifunctional oxoglutarate decarboxylase/oxoglutarate dehydrogenase thiamine pyrophosphate-binding subunit/dihydrolipoyllysine-residue succinyltransferase subunit [Thermoanaerobaculaceae bacterium]|nr:multifunctional oxoglutarate decarboxylase/oxoglutarate dehydrogenase thiamine pyrophosphate-binding subunit/dihydrolipoyllysine-residue succinyltransferase subunit [Thermoanaerobaculaceae bacterium]
MSDEPQDPASFGPNVWLIDEMYREFREHPESVSESWREFFSDYQPAAGRIAPPAPEAKPAPEPRPAAAAAVQVPPPPAAPKPAPVLPAAVPLVGPAKRLADNMTASLAVPTATTVRIIPVRLLEENRALANEHLSELAGGKLSFTHLLAWAMVRALAAAPAMRAVYAELDGVPHRVTPEHVNLGLAVDVTRRDGTRSLVVPSVKGAESLEFAAFFAAYNDLVRKANTGQLTPDDLADTNVSLTNPGMLGTTGSVPRLMNGQSLILATGAIGYPAEFAFADPHTLARLGVSKVITLTCTYDHRVIQGADSADFLGRVAALLAGEERFYDRIFASLAIPHEPVRLARDANPYLSDRGVDGLVEKQAGVLHLINMYRVRGHLVAHVNPLSTEIPTHPELELDHHGLTLWDLDREFYTGGLGEKHKATLREIIRVLREAYCGTLGVEYMFIQEPDQKAWIQRRVEGADAGRWLDAAAKRRTLAMLNAAEAFERFLHTKYIGHKRFSLEGVESLIPMLDRLLADAAAAGFAEVVIGMAHRGRLNVLANIIGKSYEKIFREFEGNLDPLSREGTGDVKYHLGASGTFRAPAGELRVRLASNPSHLEAVDPVVEGMARALQDVAGDTAKRKVLAVLIHGDAAFAGQGVVAETLNMSALSGYRTGGTIHIVTNNGIGFTTSPADARSSVYATDVAKMVQAPVFHANGEDPEACVHVMDLALEFRNEFKKDVVVDVVGYRRWGHNEADEPAYTQPIMYAKIRDRRSVRKLYTERLVNHGDLSIEEAEAALKDFQDRMEAAFEATKESTPSAPLAPGFSIAAEPAAPQAPPVALTTLEHVLQRATSVPDGFHVHPKLARLLEQRRQMLAGDAVDWGTGELLAFGSLLLEGRPVRLSGQDSRRGTFSQRHAVLVDQASGAEYTPLQHLDPGQAPFLVYDSLLSEYAVLGFEYGYSVVRTDALVAWEAQFGDFANGAQVVIDQFIAAAEEKWRQPSKLVLLLPHGAEGQGPEHSSARFERYLQLAARGNLRVAVPTTAAQYFHLLRSQAHAEGGAPLVVMTPKSLLRADAAKSRAAEFAGSFQPVLADPQPPSAPVRLLLCTGKVAFDLLAHRAKVADTASAVIRLERLYPFPEAELAAVLRAAPGAREIRWVQEEPANMGAWSFVSPLLAALVPELPVSYVGRPASSSPATGSAHLFQAEQERLVADAFEP